MGDIEGALRLSFPKRLPRPMISTHGVHYSDFSEELNDVLAATEDQIAHNGLGESFVPDDNAEEDDDTDPLLGDMENGPLGQGEETWEETTLWRPW